MKHDIHFPKSRWTEFVLDIHYSKPLGNKCNEAEGSSWLVFFGNPIIYKILKYVHVIIHQEDLPGSKPIATGPPRSLYKTWFIGQLSHTTDTGRPPHFCTTERIFKKNILNCFASRFATGNKRRRNRGPT